MHSPLYIGLMSGTSLDGVDLVAVDFTPKQPVLLAQALEPYPNDILRSLKAMCRSQQTTFDNLGGLDATLGDFYGHAIERFMSNNTIVATDVTAIGSHGQTIQHQPNSTAPYTLQIGDANRIANITKVAVVADFRRRDMAAGGQGAPLVPAFHAACFYHPEENRAIVNIGGIANVTLLPKDKNRPIIGFDCGPGNTLMDQYCQQQYNKRYDENASLATRGVISNELLNSMLDDPYFELAHPKSTGPEYFSAQWLNTQLNKHPTSPNDTLATLCELSALTIHMSLNGLPTCEKVFICGGGTHNPLLMQRLNHYVEGDVETTSVLGIHPDWVEAMAFAWLAKQTLEGKTGNIPSVTGATKAVVLGAIYSA
ncbi:MAG: anhydro-N-acetylmuramic acid kinase [Piscirickettsiaceae bacterium]|nr:MAG: anhydro-N-acetylmuramic acid kinase [Piscirickettsiaceae bacterium]